MQNWIVLEDTISSMKGEPKSISHLLYKISRPNVQQHSVYELSNFEAKSIQMYAVVSV